MVKQPFLIRHSNTYAIKTLSQINSFGHCCPEGHQNSNGLCCPGSHHNSDGLCCPGGHHNSDGMCCYEGFHNSNGLCCPEGQHNSDGICTYAGEFYDTVQKTQDTVKEFYQQKALEIQMNMM